LQLLYAKGLPALLLAFLIPQWMNVHVPEGMALDQILNVQNVRVVSDVDGVFRERHGEIDAKAISLVEQSTDQGMAMAFLSGSPVGNIPAESWNKDNPEIGDAIRLKFKNRKMPEGVKILGAMGGQTYNLKNKNHIEYYEPYSPYEMHVAAVCILHTFLATAMMDPQFKTKAEELSEKLNALNAPDKETVWLGSHLEGLRTPQVFKEIVEEIRTFIQPSLQLKFRGSEVEIQIMDIDKQRFDFKPLKRGLEEIIKGQRILKDSQVYAGSHYIKISKFSKAIAAQTFFGKRKRGTLFITVGDDVVDIPMFNPAVADLSFNVGSGSIIPADGFDHLTTVRTDNGKDEIHVRGTQAIFANLSEAFGKPFQNYRYFQMPDAEGQWHWVSIDDCLKIANASSLEEMIHQQQRQLFSFLTGFIAVVSGIVFAAWFLGKQQISFNPSSLKRLYFFAVPFVSHSLRKAA